jgi:hypothetical protein
MIISADFENQKDISDVEEDVIMLECPSCDGHCILLRD